MTNVASRLSALRRPRLLIRAARHGISDYDRETALDRLIEPGLSDTDENILTALLSAEAEVECHRREGHATYSIARHIELLVALMDEARRLANRARAA